MIKKISSIVFGGLLVLSLVSCEQDFLDKGPEEDLTLEEVFSERLYAENFLTSAYSNLPTMFNVAEWPARNPFTGASDEMEVTYTGAFSHLLNSGGWSSDYYYPDIWGYNYEGIRKLNIFLENVDQVPLGDNFDEGDRQQWIAEATFLRAYYHFFIMRIHGPIPIMDKAIGVDEDFSEIVRDPLDEVVAFIVQECEKAAEVLPMRQGDNVLGRATKGAALSLKARVLLYAASPLYNENIPPAFQQLQNNDGTLLFPQAPQSQKWEVAAQAAKQAIDAAEGAGFELYRSADNDPLRSYQDLFLENWNEEVIFARNLDYDGHTERSANPLSYGGFSIMSVTQDLVDAYETAQGETPIIGYNADGSAIVNPEADYTEQGFADAAHPKGYHPGGVSNMYVNREPRFYASVNYAGAMWKGRIIELWNRGRDGFSRGNGSDYSASGYLVKKMIDPNSNATENRFMRRTWIYFRLGELYLNYAEALNESQGPVADVYTYVNRIRNRAGLPDLEAGLSKDAMREKIRHERRIELSFETHRYFDARRWKIAEETAGGPIYGLNISAGEHLQDPEFYKREVIEDRVFEAPKHYLWPLQISEINKNLDLIQNPGW